MAAQYTRKEITLAAQETAAQLSAMLGGGGLAARFVQRYAQANRRRALLAHAARHRELIERIGREALLAMVARVEQDLARRFAAGLRPRPRGGASDATLADHFRVDFYGRLAEILDWQREELRDFWRDLDLYAGVTQAPRRRKRMPGAPRRNVDRHLGAFADRCAFLLDSSLLERARRAAAKFHRELERAARRGLRAGFRRAGIGGRCARPRPHRRSNTRHRRGKRVVRNKRKEKRKGRNRKMGGKR